jgi:uncharacterized protein TP_0352
LSYGITAVVGTFTDGCAVYAVICARNFGEVIMADDFNYEITQKYGVLSTSKSGWTLELNSVSWNGRSPKFDIRSWSPDHEKMGKGITLSTEDLAALKTLLNGMQL